ncbi:MAG TPA: flagellar type III secretion system pore protein FliP [Phycisphaerae bacterium]|nr:flagellar type III secretion system pore protein FliP [Phycisphaerae bacterium]
MSSRIGAILLTLLLLAAPAAAQQAPGGEGPGQVLRNLPDLSDRGTMSSVVKWLVVVTVVSVAPAIAVLVTSFTRIIVVLGLLRQGLGTQQLPPNSVLFGLGLLMTLVVMAPVLNDIHRDAVAPYMAGKAAQTEAVAAGETHVRAFMIRQITAARNQNDVDLFLDDALAQRKDLTWRDVPTGSLIPAFAVSELKVAFLIGFRILLPFLIIDMLVASILTSMGMLMLPPVLVSLPFKLLLFVLADGWNLVVGTLISSFG